MSTLADLLSAAPSTQILVEGFRHSLNEQGADSNIRFWFSGDDFQAFVDTVVGKPATMVTIGGVSVPRFLPLQHPSNPTARAYAMEIYPPEGSVAGIATDGLNIRFNDYFADVRFATPTYSYDGAYPLVTVSRDTGVEMVTRPGYAYRFPSDDTYTTQELGVPVATTQYSLTFHRLPTLDNDLYDGLVGCVNETTFFGKPPGTMLYTGCSSTSQNSLGGVPSYEAVQRFVYRSIPHNKIMRPDGADFEAPVEAGDPTKYLIPEAELNDLYS